MRVRVKFTTFAESIPWPVVLAPGRPLVYALLAHAAPDLARKLHDSGWGPHGMAPFGYGAPMFPEARRRRGVYAAGGKGFLELGSPLPAVVEAWATGLRRRELIDWGGVAFRLLEVTVMDAPAFTAGRARLRTATPVVMKGSGRDERGVRRTRQAWLMPTDPEFPAYFAGNLRRKAETLGLDPDIGLEKITWIGARRSYSTGKGSKPGAPIEVELRGAPETLRALWSWGLGQANAAGFGWVAACT